MIELVDVTQHYGVRPVLADLNFRVGRGERVAVLGPNGMGKSTLLGVIAGVLSPQKGYVQIDGKRRRRSAEEEADIRRQVAFLPDQPWLPARLTCREFLLAVGRLYDIDDQRLMDHIERLFELFELKDKADSAIRSLSTGQKKKVAISAALVTDARVMILDEPFSGGLDPSGILALKGVLKRLTEGGDVTIVMATPVPELVEAVAQRVVLLQDGRIVADDTPQRIRELAGPATTFDEAIGRLIHRQTTDALDRYFARTSP